MPTFPYVLPEPGADANPEDLLWLYQNGILPADRFWGHKLDYHAKFRLVAGYAGFGWADPNPLHQFNDPDYQIHYIKWDRENPRLKLTFMPSGAGSPPETPPLWPAGESFSHMATFGTLGHITAMHMNSHIAAFPEIPRLKIVTMTAWEVYNQFFEGPCSDMPIARLVEDPAQWSMTHNGRRYRTSFKEKMVVFHEGKPAIVPQGWLPAGFTPGPVGQPRLTFEQIADRSGMILADPVLTKTEKGKSIVALTR